MKNFSLLVVGLLSTAVFAEPHGHRRRNGTKHDVECMQLLHLERLLKTSSDTTLMSRITSNYPKRADMIKSQVQSAQADIATIQGNSSHPADWLQNCHVKGAHKELVHQCIERDTLPKMQNKWNDASKAAKIQKHHNWTDAQFTQEKGVLATKIKTLSDNKTLTTECPKLKDGKGGKGPDGKTDGKSGGAKAGGLPNKGSANAASGLNGAEAIRGGLFALAISLVMAVTIL